MYRQVVLVYADPSPEFIMPFFRIRICLIRQTPVSFYLSKIKTTFHMIEVACIVTCVCLLIVYIQAFRSFSSKIKEKEYVFDKNRLSILEENQTSVDLFLSKLSFTYLSYACIQCTCTPIPEKHHSFGRYETLPRYFYRQYSHVYN